MTIGYLHVGAPRHGVTRYGRVLADAARQHLGATIVEAHVEKAGPEALRGAAERLAEADVVHVQYNERIWGGPRHARRHLRAFAAGAPPFVATLHDVREGGYGMVSAARRLGRTLVERLRSLRQGTARASPSEGTARVETSRRSGGLGAALRRALRYLTREYHNTRAMRWLMRHAARVLVCSEEEKRRLAGMPGVPQRVIVLPHFVEARTLPVGRRAAQEQLGLAPGPVVTVLGFIHRRKGHALVVEALPLMPEHTQVVFAGAPTRHGHSFAAGLRRRAETLGVADRLRMTGYLAEEELNHYLAATDLALCPFRSMAASGSLSTWIAAGRPVLASDLPQIREYITMAPGALATFSPHTPEALAQAIRAQLSSPAERAAGARQRLQQRLSLEHLINEHALCYRQGAQARDPHPANKRCGAA